MLLVSAPGSIGSQRHRRTYNAPSLQHGVHYRCQLARHSGTGLAEARAFGDRRPQLFTSSLPLKRVISPEAAS
jgi:hypothetical protein